MKTVLYLLRHGATEANIARPPILQGRRLDGPLAPIGVKQAQVTRDLLAVRPIDRCYTSPLARAVQTASIICRPHGLTPKIIEAITECDVGRWESLDWDTIRRQEPDAYDRFMANPGRHGYPEGESFTDVHQRTAKAIENILDRNSGKTILVVGHHIVNRTYLAGLLGLSPCQARLVTLDNCGVSVVVRESGATSLATLNASFHLQGIAA